MIVVLSWGLGLEQFVVYDRFLGQTAASAEVPSLVYGRSKQSWQLAGVACLICRDLTRPSGPSMLKYKVIGEKRAVWSAIFAGECDQLAAVLDRGAVRWTVS